MSKLFLVAYYYQRPSEKRVRTNRSGWMNNEKNVAFDEQVALTKNLSNRDYDMAKVILDMVHKKVIKNGWNTTKSFDDMFLYFHEGYPQYTAEVMHKLDYEYLGKILPTYKKEISSSGTISSV
jgi:hypothetical protein